MEMEIGTVTARAGERYLRMKVGVNHPLANRSGWTWLHRVVCYGTYGPSDHPCHWCGWVLPWRMSSEIDDRAHRHCINVDHLDADTHNNHWTNLVPSCWWCNANRHWQPVAPDLFDELIAEYKHIHPADRPSGITWLAMRCRDAEARLQPREGDAA